MDARINPAIEPIVREFKAALQAMYGDRLRDVVLYGSYARGDYDDESDIDLMIVLNDERVDTFAEIRRISPLETRLLLDYGLVVSPLPVPYSRYKDSSDPIYQEVRKDGMVL
ncbi:nucleotidyltransferase domain-containing protein [Spirosoma rhododendri]|uniref:Nucleotidyltransferase domain-containing protein n=1 Tax=Spirosoma rhododendri TaxID=2728024 RepID=A0A7L5DRI9_9BACT|nr:nucleotidyltransferase domain-containing protein [Spirosoma rhododendri]QJD79178.1 nucleotidyltransferase domain-containing protein [Spirosoma rhododendri]